MELRTTYLGLSLDNPIIVGSCGLTQDADKIRKCEQAGAGAVVMKSLFEEQIRSMDPGLLDDTLLHPEVIGYIQAELGMLYGPREYLETIEAAKKSVSIPVIASINCHTSKWWLDYARQIEAAGADALELNAYVFPLDPARTGADLEKVYVEILDSVKRELRIPVAMKLPPYVTSFGNLAAELASRRADGLVLFNRFVNPEIDIHTLKVSVKASFSDIQGFYTSLRWIALLSGELDLDIVPSGNIHTSEDVIKQILAGAPAVQVVSVLYSKGLREIEAIKTGLAEWMREKKLGSIDEFRGRLNQTNNPQSMAYIRAQYIKQFAGIE